MGHAAPPIGSHGDAALTYRGPVTRPTLYQDKPLLEYFPNLEGRMI